MSKIKICKLTISDEEFQKACNNISNNNYIEIESTREFNIKPYFEDKKMLQKTLIIYSKNKDILVNKKADKEEAGVRKMGGYSILVSSQSHEEAFEKLINVPKSLTFKDKVLTQNKNYIFDTKIYQVDDISGIVFNIKDDTKAKDKIVTVAKNQVIEFLGKKKMEIALYNKIMEL